MAMTESSASPPLLPPPPTAPQSWPTATVMAAIEASPAATAMMQ